MIAHQGYTLDDLAAAYHDIGIREGSIVILKTDMRLLGPYSPKGSESVMDAHLSTLSRLINLQKGTLVVTTASTGLCNSATAFDPATTPSEMGMLSEHIRRQPGAVRSFHPFLSYSALGRHAADICLDVSRHGFGPETPKSRLLDLDALFVSLGQHPRLTASVVHHAEMLMGVPYRYVKEFMHPVRRGSEMKTEPFYMHVWYRECGNNHDGVKKIFDFFTAQGGRTLERNLGAGQIYSFSLRKYFDSNIKALKSNLFMFLKEEPPEKPYRK